MNALFETRSLGDVLGIEILSADLRADLSEGQIVQIARLLMLRVSVRGWPRAGG